jgi:competence protein ComEA
MFNRKEQTALLLLGVALLVGSALAAVDYFRPAAMEEFRVVPAAAAPPPAEAAASVPVSAPTPPSPAGLSRGPAASGGPVDINLATGQQLLGLPGIGPAIAGRIVAYRDAHGPFAAVSELDKVKGIGPKTLARLRPLVVCSARERR